MKQRTTDAAILDDFFTADRSSVALLILLSLLLFFLNLGGRDLWAPDEGEYAQISQEMLESGDWTIPRMNALPWAQKPPLFNWAIATLSLLPGRVTELTARLPSALMGMVGVLATYWLGKTLYGGSTGLFSALILATSPLYIHQARWVQVDMLMAGLVTLTLSSFYLGYIHPTRRLRYYLLGSLFIGLGTLTKGPLAVVLPGLTLLTFTVLKGELKEFLTRKLFLCLLLFLAVTCPWYIAVYFKGGPDFARELLLKHNFGMFFDTWSHKQPFYYYLWNLPWTFFPWIVFLPSALAHLFSTGERQQRLFLLSWFIGMFCFFSLSQAKQGKYLLPLLPCLALIVGRFWESILLEKDVFSYKKGLVIPMAFLAGVLILGGGAGPWFIHKRYPEFLNLSIPLGTFLALCGGSILLTAFYGRKRTIFITLIVMLVLVMTYTSIFLQSELNHYKSAKPFCQEAVRIIKGGELGIYGIYYHKIGPYLFYTKKRVKTFYDQDSVVKFFNSEDKVFCIMGDISLESLKKSHTVPTYTLLSAAVGHRSVHLVSNCP